MNSEFAYTAAGAKHGMLVGKNQSCIIKLWEDSIIHIKDLCTIPHLWGILVIIRCDSSTGQALYAQNAMLCQRRERYALENRHPTRSQLERKQPPTKGQRGTQC